MKKNFLSVLLAILLSSCLLSVNCFAFDFDGDTRTYQDIYSDWFANIKDFCTGQKDFDSFVAGNQRFQTDIVASALYPGSSEELNERISTIQEQLRSASESTDNSVDDTFVDVFGAVLETTGLVDFRQQFETWYQDKYGKEYGKHDLPNVDDLRPNTRYYIRCEKFVLGFTVIYTAYFNSDLNYFPVYTDDYGYKYIEFGSSDIIGTSYSTYSGFEEPYASQNGRFEGDVSGRYTFQCPNDLYTNGVVLSHNLPLTLNGENYDDGTFEDTSEPDLVAPTISLPEIGDLLTDLETDINETNDPNNPNKGIELKITKLMNKLHADLSEVIAYLKKIFLKICDFFDNFFDRLSEFFQSIFIPQDDYFNNTLLDIQAAFDEAFSFAGDLRLIVDTCISSYKNGGTNPPEIDINIDGYGTSHKLDFSIFDKTISLVRSVICAVCYASFALSTYRRIPLYISGGGDK